MEETEDPMCLCQHPKSEHHLSWLPGGYELADECEFFGTNETGGAEYINGKWVTHCMKFKLNKEANHGPRTDSEV